MFFKLNEVGIQSQTTAMWDRFCMICHQIEDEAHFLIDCTLYDIHRQELYVKISARWTDFTLLFDHGKFIFLMSCTDPYILGWLGKSVYKSFDKQAENLSIKNNNSITTLILMHRTTVLTVQPCGYNLFLFVYSIAYMLITFKMAPFTINGNFF